MDRLEWIHEIKTLIPNKRRTAMKSKHVSLAAGAMLVASAMMIAGKSVSAEELPQTKAHEQFSVTKGFAKPALPALHRSGAVDQNKVTGALIEKLGLESIPQSTKHGETLHLGGKQWSLDVTADGNGVEYQDAAAGARAHALGKPVTQKMSADELEQKGRDFIASKLSSQIVLGANEELVAVRADYRFEGGQDAKTGEVSQAVVANRIVFGRTLNGVPVVGNGSKVVLTFVNDGSLESFRYDWPQYQAAASQNLVDAGEILSRVQKVIGARNGVATPTSGVAVPSSEGQAYPVALTPNTKLQALECGYYDAGSFTRHAAQSVQPGCAYHAVSQDSNGMRAGYAGAVPAGDQFDQDEAWLETQILAKK
jgi:hypothetical protein